MKSLEDAIKNKKIIGNNQNRLLLPIKGGIDIINPPYAFLENVRINDIKTVIKKKTETPFCIYSEFFQ